ncbi:MAG TPA: hypothetical protein VJY39_22760 [Acidisphaera sp.]|nr:hypothetical protein [Acidisphaera sp.]
MSEFDLWQQAYVLSWAANAMDGTSGTKSELENGVKDDIGNLVVQAPVGNWAIVWGPVAYIAHGAPVGLADNAMFVLYNEEAGVYLVAASATNFASYYDWTDEDFSVSRTVAWKAAFSAALGPYGPDPTETFNPCLSDGTAKGVGILLNMRDASTLTLAEFLRSRSAAGLTADLRLVFTGHSLAGALVPVLAAAAFNPQGGPLAVSDWKTVNLMPRAGATPGNADLSTFIASVFPPVPASDPAHPYQVWNSDIANSLDIVPHAWETTTLAELPTLYKAEWDSAWVESLVWLLVEAPTLASTLGAQSIPDGSQWHAGPYARLPFSQFAGTYNPEFRVTDIASYLLQAVYQHLGAYDVFFQVDGKYPLSGVQLLARTSAARRALEGMLAISGDDLNRRRAKRSSTGRSG